MNLKNPNEKGRFGPFGGRYVPETLVPACHELEKSFIEAWEDDSFRKELDFLLSDYAGRPSPITECFNLSAELNCRLLLKREDLNHTGSHKINNVLGQALLAKRMGKKRLVAETGAGQHGVATATAAALLNLECCVYMGEVDVKRQELNVFRMKLLGAEVRSVESGSKTLKDAVNDAMRDWVATVEDSYYCLGSVMGPHPYPWMVRTFQEVIGTEARKQSEEILGTTPDVVCACVGGGSNAIGIFSGFIDSDAELIGVEPARGQVIFLKQDPGVGHFDQQQEALTYTIPRSDITVLGGTVQIGDWGMEIRPEDNEAILQKVEALWPEMDRSKIIGGAVGLRPSRNEVRLETEDISGRFVVHNYGHGGAGVTLSWGCAEEVVEIVTKFA